MRHWHDLPTRRLAVAGAALAVALGAVAACAALERGLSAAHLAGTSSAPGWWIALTGVAMVVPGALMLVARRGRAVMAVLLAGGLLWTVDALAQSWLAAATASEPALPGATAAFFVFARVGAALLLCLPLLLVLQPEGRLPAGRWRAPVLLSLASTALLPLVLLGLPSRVVDQEPVPGADLDPLPQLLPDAVWPPLLATANALVPVSLVVPFAYVVVRARGAAGPARTRARWLLWAALAAVVVMALVRVLPPGVSSAALGVAVALVSGACAAGWLRPGLLDVDRLLSGTVVWVLVAGSVLLVDVAAFSWLAGLLGGRLPERDAALLAVLLVTAVYGPLRERTWSLVRRAVLGERDDPWRAVGSLARRLEGAADAQEQLLAVAGAVAHAFRVDDVVVEVHRADGGRLVATHGHRPEPAHRLPLRYRGAPLGEVLLPEGAARSRLSARDERLLADLVRQGAIAARAEFLAESLQHSRARILAVREEDRRRVRRDLHDGLGPVLGASVMAVDTVLNLAPDLPEQARAALRRVRDDVREAMGEVRRLVHDLRPPALDDLGLLGALRQHAEHLRAAGGPGAMAVSVEGGPLGELPAAVEVAAYRIVAEAVANALRHSGASACGVRLSREGTGAGARLVVEVRDDGVGIAEDAPAGVGLVAMRERTGELGGWCSVTCSPGGGTAVRAVLPLVAAGSADRVGELEVARG